MTHVLIVASMIGYGGVVSFQEFGSLETCEEAKKAVLEMATPPNILVSAVRARCVPKWDERRKP